MKKIFVLLTTLLTAAIFFISCHVGTKETFQDEDVICKFIDEAGQEIVSKTDKVSVSTLTGVQAPVTFTFNKTDFEKTGYNLSKIQDKSGAEITFTEDTISISLEESTAYTVIYTPITYTIKFQEFTYSQTNDGYPESLTCKYDEEISLPENTIAKDGKKCYGWDYSYQDAEYNNKTDTYKNGDKIKNLTTKDGDVLVFTPSYKDYDFILTFEFYNYTKTEIGIDEGQTLAAENIPQVPEREGFTAGGWYLKDDESKTDVDFTKFKADKNVIFVANYAPKSYKVTFVSDHGTAPEELTMTGPEVYYYGLDSLECKGYTFEGWFDKDDNKIQSLTAVAVGWNYEDMTLTAKWTPWKATLILVYEGWHVNSVSDQAAKDENGNPKDTEISLSFGETVTIPAGLYIRNGYTLSGWKRSGATELEITDGGQFTLSEMSNPGEQIRMNPVWVEQN